MKLLHRGAFFTQKLSCKDAFTHRSIYTEKLLHTGAFSHRSVYIEKSLHRAKFTQSSFYTQTRLHADALSEGQLMTTSQAEPLPQVLGRFKVAISPQLLALDLHSCEKVASEVSKSQFHSIFGQSFHLHVVRDNISV